MASGAAPLTPSAIARQDRPLAGIHHVTAIAGDPQANADFYTGVLGLRLVKKTVNYDDPGTYHLYYGDELGRPGTLLTFFPWPHARRGQLGAGQATVTSFSVPAGSLGYWSERLRRSGTGHDDPRRRNEDEEFLRLLDPDGLELELVAHAGPAPGIPWEGGPVPVQHAIGGLFAVTLVEWNADRTADLLTGTLGFRLESQTGSRFRFAVGAPAAADAGGPPPPTAALAGTGLATRLDLLAEPAAGRGRISAGTVHHVAWRVAGDREQQAWHRDLTAGGHHVSPIMDRQYFHSIYFREPGGVLFEIATDPPGMTADESAAQLGSGLRLPSWLEPARARIEPALPPLAARVASAAGMAEAAIGKAGATAGRAAAPAGKAVTAAGLAGEP
ncbi:MAG TPA: ring-cleaving dioxygenase [Thermoanaerobaculia bacterium]|nr:ring-cleaving dioxygenase [Thermoanaerobaculia bacterium]